MRRVTRVALATAAIWVVAAGVASAQDAGPTVESLSADLDVVWVAAAAAMVFLMQAGFTLVEAGLTRSKNVANIATKNLTDMVVGAVFYWSIGAAFAYGSTGGFIGTAGFFDPAAGLGDGTQFVFQMVFAATAATIVSGAVAERMKFAGYVVVSILITGFIYPIVTHWQWAGDGSWLFDRGYHDFAGSSLVHMVGGIAAFVGAAMLGPRIGKYGKDGKPRAIPGHNIPFVILGVFVLWFGWFGFNGGSTLGATGQAEQIGIILLSTCVAAGAGGMVAGAVTWFMNGKMDPAMAGNGVLAGLVGITAGTNFATGPEALAIGGMCGGIVVAAVLGFDRIRIDDPVGAISVHGVCGAIGTLAVGVIAAGESNGAASGATISLGTQAIGVVAIGAFTGLASLVVFAAVKATIGLRVSAQEEIDGLDLHEHGIAGYPDLVFGASGSGGAVPGASVTESARGVVGAPRPAES